MFGILNSFSQHTISGKIIDELNQSLPFANIVIEEIGNKKTPTGTISTDNGDYLLENVASGKYTIEISMLGFETQKIDEVEINSNKIINITLKEES
ncbi:MAG: carboxypeptidase-like regulatory domain-containing protein, partial [Polaribacter sp.]|nr:carboxypeptidase-like regulatory domain-containing protein [Polaribacter sp.]